ncbi:MULTISPECIES: dTMP kinase [unclassified Acinetobacter]|uniref:dTMP kinase n=1 Tax=unclassified Acinetobacter TaxID=196816 RepID=UPI0035B842F4
MFISFEGTEGVGKSTLIANVQHALQQKGHDVVLTREPGGTPLAEKIRQIVLEKNQEQLVNKAELLLMYAARAQHIEQVILPALQQQKMVLCDRFIDASMAYQHGGRGLPKSLVDVLNDNFVDCLPEITFWLDLPVEVGMQRAKKRGELDRFEQEDIDFFQKIHDCYAMLAEQFPQRFCRLDANLSPEQLTEQALKHIAEKLALKSADKITG